MYGSVLFCLLKEILLMSPRILIQCTEMFLHILVSKQQTGTLF